MFYSEKNIPIRKKIIHYVLIYLLIATSGGMLGELIGNDNFVLLRLAISAWFIIVINKGIMVRKIGVWVIAFVILSVLTMVYSSLSIFTVLNICSCIFLVYTAIQYDPEHVIQRFLNFGWVICWVSFSIYLILTIVGFDALAPFYTKLYTSPINDYALGNGYGGLLFYRFIPIHSHQNCGPFSEPGEYAIYLNVLLYLAIVYGREFVDKKRNSIFIILVIVSILTCQSTSGYIMLFILLIINVFSKKDSLLRNRYIIFMVLAGIIFFRSNLVDLFHSAVTNKVVFDGVVDLSQGTGQARYSSIIDIARYIYENPLRIFGVGFDTLLYDGVKRCVGFLLMLLTVGVFAFVELYGYYFLESFSNRKSNSEYLMEIAIIIVTGFSQPALIFAEVFFMGMFKMMLGRNETE